MADHDVDICNNWNGNQGDKVTFINNTKSSCIITQKGNIWPFKDGPPLPLPPEGSIPSGGTYTTHLKTPLKNGHYPYNVDCCPTEMPKTVTVP